MEVAAAIPLLNRHGESVGTAFVSESDYDWLSAFAWRLGRPGYAQRTVFAGKGATPRVLLMHREILGLRRGDGLYGDHINGRKLDNRRTNLRVLTPAQSAQNVSSTTGSTSRYRNVDWWESRQKWRVRGYAEGRHHHIGYFDDEDEAGAAAEAWRREHMPFARELTAA